MHSHVEHEKRKKSQVGVELAKPNSIVKSNIEILNSAPTLYHSNVCKKKQFDLHYSMAIE